jgi:hypothetical protein
MGCGSVATNLLDRMVNLTRPTTHHSGLDFLGLHESLILSMTSETISGMILGMTFGTI